MNLSPVGVNLGDDFPFDANIRIVEAERIQRALIDSEVLNGFSYLVH